MNGVEVISAAFGGAHQWFTGTAGDVTQEQADSVPPGTAHPIGVLIAHIAHTEDLMINTAAQGKPTLWESAGWSTRLGGKLMFDQEMAEARAYKCDVKGMLEYCQSVFANTAAYLAGISDSDLDREVDLKAVGLPQNMSLGSFLGGLLLANTIAHTGEISAGKGILGGTGYPF